MEFLRLRQNPRRMMGLRVLAASFAIALFGFILAFAVGEHTESLLGNIGVILVATGVAVGLITTIAIFILDFAGAFRWLWKMGTPSRQSFHSARYEESRRAPQDRKLAFLRAMLLNPRVSLMSAFLALVGIVFLKSPIGNNPIVLLTIGGIGGIAAIAIICILSTTVGRVWLQKRLSVGEILSEDNKSISVHDHDKM